MAQNSDSIDAAIRFSSRTITRALRTLEPIFGPSMVDALIYDFEVYDLPLVNDRTEYGFAEIKIAIEKIFGDATHLFLERMVRALNAVAE